MDLKHKIAEIIASQHMCHDHCCDGQLYCACRMAAEGIVALLGKNQKDPKNLPFYLHPDYGRDDAVDKDA